MVRRYSEGVSACKLAKGYDVTVVTMIRWLKKLGVKTRTQKEVASKLRKGGRWTDYRGYVRVLRHGHPRANAKGQVHEHIVMWEKYHPDDPILPGEVIHHNNMVKDDNRKCNLEKLTVSEHSRRTAKEARCEMPDDYKGKIGERLGHELLKGSKWLSKDRHWAKHDLLWKGKKIDVKAAFCINNNSWHFGSLKNDGRCDEYLFLVVKSDKIERAWMISAKNAHKNHIALRTSGRGKYYRFLRRLL